MAIRKYTSIIFDFQKLDFLDLLTESRAKARSAEEQVLHYKQEMENAQNNVKRITEEQNHLEQELHVS